MEQQERTLNPSDEQKKPQTTEDLSFKNRMELVKQLQQAGGDITNNYYNLTAAVSSGNAELSKHESQKINASEQLLEKSGGALKQHYATKTSVRRILASDIAIETIYCQLVVVTKQSQKDKEVKILSQSALKHYKQYEALYLTKSIDPIKPEQLFEERDKRKPKRLLIGGRPGIGKSTLCQKLAFDWSKGLLWKGKFRWIFWIQLKEFKKTNFIDTEYKNNIHSLAKLVIDSCFSSFEDISVDTLVIILKQHADQVLFILDGYDEIIGLKEQKPNLWDILYSLINDYHYHLILTSRPYYIENSLFDLGFENIGFNDESIQKYVEETLSLTKAKDKLIGDPERLLNYMNKNPSMWGIAHVPLFLNLITCLWSHWHQKQTIPSSSLSLTRLYNEIIDIVLDNYLKSHKKLDTNNLSSSQIRAKCRSELVFLSKLAFESLKKHNIIITGSDIGVIIEVLSEQNILITFSDVFRIGFLNSLSELEKLINNDFYFLHLSLQEYFVAYHIVDMIRHNKGSSKDLNVLPGLRDSHYKIIHYQLVWPFVAGLLYKDKEASEKFFQYHISNFANYPNSYGMISLILCYEEGSVSSSLRTQILERIIASCKLYLTNEIFPNDSPIINYLEHSPKLCQEQLFQTFLMEIFASDGYCLTYKQYSLLEKIRYVSNTFQERLFDYLKNPDNARSGKDIDDTTPPFKWDICINLIENNRIESIKLNESLQALLKSKFRCCRNAAVQIIEGSLQNVKEWLDDFVLNEYSAENHKEFDKLQYHVASATLKKLKIMSENLLIQNLEADLKKLAEQVLLQGDREQLTAEIILKFSSYLKMNKQLLSIENLLQQWLQGESWQKLLAILILSNSTKHISQSFQENKFNLVVFISDKKELLSRIFNNKENSKILRRLSFRLLIEHNALLIVEPLQCIKLMQEIGLPVSYFDKFHSVDYIAVINQLCEMRPQKNVFLFILLEYVVKKLDDFSGCYENLSQLLKCIFEEITVSPSSCENGYINNRYGNVNSSRIFNSAFRIAIRLLIRDHPSLKPLSFDKPLIEVFYKTSLKYLVIEKKIRNQEELDKKGVNEIITLQRWEDHFYVNRLAEAIAKYNKHLGVEIIEWLFKFLDREASQKILDLDAGLTSIYECLVTLLSTEKRKSVLGVIDKLLSISPDELYDKPLHRKLVLQAYQWLDRKPYWLTVNVTIKEHGLFGRIAVDIISRLVNHKLELNDIQALLKVIEQISLPINEIDKIFEAIKISSIEKEPLFKLIFGVTTFSFDPESHYNDVSDNKLTFLEEAVKKDQKFFISYILKFLPYNDLAIKLLMNYPLDDYFELIFNNNPKIKELEVSDIRTLFNSSSAYKLLRYSLDKYNYIAFRSFFYITSTKLTELNLDGHILFVSIADEIRELEIDKDIVAFLKQAIASIASILLANEVENQQMTSTKNEASEVNTSKLELNNERDVDMKPQSKKPKLDHHLNYSVQSTYAKYAKFLDNEVKDIQYQDKKAFPQMEIALQASLHELALNEEQRRIQRNANEIQNLHQNSQSADHATISYQLEEDAVYHSEEESDDDLIDMDSAEDLTTEDITENTMQGNSR